MRYPGTDLPERLAATRGTEQEPSVRRPRRLVLSVAALGLALGASGCAYINPTQTHAFYEAAEGTHANLDQSGSVFAGVRNALVIVAEDGTAVFSGTVANYTSEELTVEVEGVHEGAVTFATQATVPAHGTLELGPGEGQQSVAIGALDVPPGALMDLSVTASGESTVITLPVFDDSLSHFQDYVAGVE